MDIQQRPTSGPKDFFIHLLTFGLLYTFAVSFISLWWQYVNIKFPDVLKYYYYGYDQLRWPMAVLIIVFPIFVVLSRMTTKAIVADPSRKDSRMYRWLIYLTLFVSAVTVIVDLISLLYNFLGGELTLNFALKVLVILIVSLGIFGYYLWHLRSDVSQTGKKRHALLWSSIVVMIGSIILGFVFVGSPAMARARKFDEQRINDLQNLQGQIINHWIAKGKLPNNVTEIRDDIAGYQIPMDPRYGGLYGYQTTGPLSFRTCAEFETDNLNSSSLLTYPLGYGRNSSWAHSKGQVCFSRTIDPDFYKNQPVPLKY